LGEARHPSEGDHLVLDNIKYYAKYGYKDYGIIYMSCKQGAGGGFSAWVASITRYGTGAALMWMLENPDELSGRMLIVVQWIDANWDNAVDPSEIVVIKTIP